MTSSPRMNGHSTTKLHFQQTEKTLSDDEVSKNLFTVTLPITSSVMEMGFLEMERFTKTKL